MPEKNDLAEERTDWAEDRTILANERTFAGWLRTGMASLAIAVGMHAVFREFEPTWVAKSAATVFILLAIYIFWAARETARETLKRLTNQEAQTQPSRRMTKLWIVFTIGAIGIGAILWAI
ncbi:DUF202 domain-containing protein [Hoeflea sp.]|uniref:YidH family protein n=1 Tax=Hoeflea sp. TaxID=1940281 RepID=UPI001988942D|nr:DUF202 domain-containing protein [Hoeflea sp.]MBC7283281.1 DUF202 domain-containing protein [Hoeflea sp.]